MKKLIFPLALAVLAVGSVSAQDVLFYAKLKKDEVPAEVVKAVTEDFKDGWSVTEYRALPVEIVEGSWFIKSKPEQQNKDYDTFEVIVSGHDITGRATYDAKGNLISLVENEKNVALPSSIEKSIAVDFPGWTASRGHETVTINNQDQKKVYYRIELTKGKEEKTVFYDGSDNLVKVDKEHERGWDRLHNSSKGMMNKEEEMKG